MSIELIIRNTLGLADEVIVATRSEDEDITS